MTSRFALSALIAIVAAVPATPSLPDLGQLCLSEQASVRCRDPWIASTLSVKQPDGTLRPVCYCTLEYVGGRLRECETFRSSGDPRDYPHCSPVQECTFGPLFMYSCKQPRNPKPEYPGKVGEQCLGSKKKDFSVPNCEQGLECVQDVKDVAYCVLKE